MKVEKDRRNIMSKYTVKFITDKRWYSSVTVEADSGREAIAKVSDQVKALGEIMNTEEAQFIQIK